MASSETQGRGRAQRATALGRQGDGETGREETQASVSASRCPGSRVGGGGQVDESPACWLLMKG